MRKLWWIPNFLSLLRGFVLAPAIAIIILWDWLATGWIPGFVLSRLTLITEISIPHPAQFFSHLVWAFGLTVVGVASDGADGFLAKRYKEYGWQTEFGAVLDPLMDKIFGLVVFCAIPLYYGVGWYLPAYIAVGAYVISYSRVTTRMRKARQISSASGTAQWKTALQMVVKIIYMADIAFAAYLVEMGQSLLQATALSIFAFSAVLCHFSLRGYQQEAAAKARRGAVPAK